MNEAKFSYELKPAAVQIIEICFKYFKYKLLFTVRLLRVHFLGSSKGKIWSLFVRCPVHVLAVPNDTAQKYSFHLK